MANNLDVNKIKYMKRAFKIAKENNNTVIIEYLWRKLNRWDLQPVMHQFIRKQDGKYILLDIYFPQIDYGIQIGQENTKQKQMYTYTNKDITIDQMLMSINDTKELIVKKVETNKKVQEIHECLDQIVSEINKIIDSNILFTPWTTTEIQDKKNTNKFISIDDKYRYRTILEVAHLLGKNYKGIQRGYFPVKDNYYAWCPQLAIKVEDKLISGGAHGWINYLSDDWVYIYETHTNTLEIKPLTKQTTYLRLTFARTKDFYGKNSFRFIGVYEHNQKNSSEDIRVYKRIENRYEL